MIFLPKNYLDYMTTKPLELTNYINEKPIAYIPFGALEWHGEHNVLGVDSIKATEICRKSAEITGGVLFPCVNWGAFDTMNFPFTFKFSKKALKRNTWIMMKALYEMGFRYVILITGHYPGSQVKNVKKAAQKFTKKYQDAFALGIPEQALVTDLGYIGDHAGEWETSIMMAINPDFVDIDRIEKDLLYSERLARHGIMGRDPSVHASSEKGKEMLEEIVNRLSAAVLNVIETQSIKAFEEIYDKYGKAIKDLIGVDIEKLNKMQGIESWHELKNYVIWKKLKKGRQIKDYKS